MLKIGSRVILVIVAVLMSGISGICTPPMSVQLPVPLKPQLKENWCWAASAQMVKNFVARDEGLNVEQCDEASKLEGVTTNCCTSPGESECDKPGWPNFGAPDFKALDTWGSGPPPPSAVPLKPLPWKTIKKEIGCAGRPFVFAWMYVSTGGHMMVITGYARSEGVRSVFVNDPSPPNEGAQYGQTYDWYAAQTGTALHWRDLYGIEYIGTEE
jgi:Peptidase_C39 like family